MLLRRNSMTMRLFATARGHPSARCCPSGSWAVILLCGTRVPSRTCWQRCAQMPVVAVLLVETTAHAAEAAVLLRQGWGGCRSSTRWWSRATASLTLATASGTPPGLLFGRMKSCRISM